MATSQTTQHDSRLAYLCLAVLLFAWAILPPLTMPNIALDAAEGLIWGRNFELGYAKHPPLQAWLLEATHLIFGKGSFAHVWLSALCIVLTHFAVWRAALRFVDAKTAFWASAALQTIYFHNYALPEFNPNVLQLPIFAFAGLFAIDAFQRGRARDWLLLGLVVGIGIYVKYSAALLALTIAAFFLADSEARRRLALPWPYAGAILALLVAAPHLYWIYETGGQTLDYVAARAQIAPTAVERAESVLELLANMLIGLPLLLALMLGRPKKADRVANPAPAPNGRRIAYWLMLGPLVLTLLAVVIAGFRIKAAWLAPLWVWTPLAGFLLFRISADQRRWRIGAGVVVAMTVLGLGAYIGNNLARPYISGKAMRVQFPGQALADNVDRIWASQTTQPLRVVIGPTLAAGSVAHYSRFEPLARVDDDEQANPWAPDTLIADTGAIILWDAGDAEALPPEINARRPDAIYVETLTLPQQTGADTPPARIGVAVLPPRDGFQQPG